MSDGTSVNVTTQGHTTVTVTKANGEVEVSTTLQEGAVVTTTVNGGVSVPTEIAGPVEVNVSPIETVVVDVTPMSPVTVDVTTGAFAGAGSNAITGLTGDVTATGPGSVPATISANAVSNSKLATMDQSRIKGRAAGSGSGNPIDLTATEATAILNAFGGDSGAGGTKGLVPAPIVGDSTRFLRGDGQFAEAGTGDMTKAVYDPQNAGYISGANDGGTGGTLQMQSGSGASAHGGLIHTHGGTGAGAAGGGIAMQGGSATTAFAGSLVTNGGTAAGAQGGTINTSGGTVSGGSITTANGGGSINTATAGTGRIEMGVAATRTTINGSATTPRTHVTPDADGTYALATTTSFSSGNTFIHPIATSSTSDSTTNALPIDDTIPQITEGKEYLTITITPKNASSALEIEFVGWVGASAGLTIAVALFKDSDADALPATTSTFVASNIETSNVILKHKVVTAGAGSRTYRIRFGSASGTAYMLRRGTGELFSTAKEATLKVTEILP